MASQFQTDKVDNREAVTAYQKKGISHITLEEVQKNCNISKTNATPGPDGFALELYNFVSGTRCSTKCGLKNRTLMVFAYAKVPLFKPELPEHYRPVSYREIMQMPRANLQVMHNFESGGEKYFFFFACADSKTLQKPGFKTS